MRGTQHTARTTPHLFDCAPPTSSQRPTTITRQPAFWPLDLEQCTGTRLKYRRHGKSLATRAETPCTSPPLPDDFDAITTRRCSRTTKTTTVEQTSSGLFDQLDAVTRATSTTPAAASTIVNFRRRRKKGGGDEWNPRRPQQSEDGAQDRGLRRTRGKDRIKSGMMHGNGHARTGPVAGQDYEIVEHQVLEEGPERTVSISRWREQVIQDTDSDDDMSIYYLNAEGCVQNGGGPVYLSPGVRRLGSILSIGRSDNLGGTSGRRGESSRSRRDVPVQASASLLRGTHSEQQQGPEGERAATSSGQAATSAVNKKSEMNLSHRPGSKKSATRSRPSSRRRTSTPRGSGTLIHQPDVSDSPPFRAKRSDNGSSISSIHFTPTVPIQTLEHVLVSCEPSLLHVAPILQRIGILRTEHLRAVGRLTEETRNKEVKEEVLKLGVTVVEWAILLDKLRSM
ncbi:hypothetical protein GGX14DRAFT_476681 [Mycena pura]|uniref:Uncharacterized protein n=1 Tax=Mycena pura TaxID=153505 RepID=A0AAD6Y345_9AGAR|nr:hypothetical protein GGX14DRAFT_476681 [Mycena pura]